MSRTCITAVALLLLHGIAFQGMALANEPVPDTTLPDTDESGLEVVLVVGEQPGPGLWKVSSGEHVMWILGEISPCPRKVRWKSKNFSNL